MTESRVFSLRWDAGFVEAVDKARGDVPRSKFLQRITEESLGIKAGKRVYRCAYGCESDRGGHCEKHMEVRYPV